MQRTQPNPREFVVTLVIMLPAVIAMMGPNCTPPSSPTYPIVDDGGPPADACEASCRNQRRLQCPFASGKASPAGVSCEQVCRESSADAMRPDCVATAADCGAVQACFR